MNFTINKIPQKPIRFYLQKKKEVSLEEYQSWISKQCANEISYWLNHAKKKQAEIITKQGRKILEPSDIAILIRNQKEANLIQTELKKINIESVYSSPKNSVFQTFDAQELLWILESILDPDNKILLKQSISTHILKTLTYTMQNKSKNSFFIIEKLYEYYNMWQEIGIFYMIKKMILDYQKNSSFVEIKAYYKKNLNFLHIAELLEEKFQSLNKKKYLIYWFREKLSEQKNFLQNERVRFLDTSQSVNIVTIYKSKGLEYPIVWIPFSIDFNHSKLSFYHDENNFKKFFSITKNHEVLKKSDQERLAEDIRLLYVAITRSIVHCSIGIACLVKKKIKDRKDNDLHQSGLGYVIQQGKTMDYASLFNTLNKLGTTSNYIETKHSVNRFALPIIDKKVIYLIKQPSVYFKHNINNICNIISFTKLKRENKSFIKDKKDYFFEDFINHNSIQKNKKLTIHHFPQGKKTGLMIHYILKNLHFLKNKNENWYTEILEKYNIPSKWTIILMNWIKNIIDTKLNNDDIVLSKIEEKSCVKEFEFFLPIKNILYQEKLNQIIQSFDSISQLSPKFFFNPVSGILKGSIDLFFFWNNKYYILDYKSNWLGKNDSFYTKRNIEKEIIKQRYDLQYQIYTIAIHKYLKKKVLNYNYENDFGGVFYIFLRSINNQKKASGIFYTIPKYLLIKKIIELF